MGFGRFFRRSVILGRFLYVSFLYVPFWRLKHRPYLGSRRARSAPKPDRSSVADALKPFAADLDSGSDFKVLLLGPYNRLGVLPGVPGRRAVSQDRFLMGFGRLFRRSVILGRFLYVSFLYVPFWRLKNRPYLGSGRARSAPEPDRSSVADALKPFAADLDSGSDFKVLFLGPYNRLGVLPGVPGRRAVSQDRFLMGFGRLFRRSVILGRFLYVSCHSTSHST